jgi:transcriptional regulator with XRE-family HTH domain
MAETAKKLGCSQNNLTYIEQGKTNPSQKFLKKCIEIYEISEAEKADFIAQALESSNRLILDLNKSKEIPKDYLAKIIAVLVFNLEEPYPDTPDWKAINQAANVLKEYLRRRPKPFTTIQ